MHRASIGAKINQIIIPPGALFIDIIEAQSLPIRKTEDKIQRLK